MDKKENGKEYVLGVLGGMGTYATIHLFQQYAEIFPAEKEWDRPRIIIDNNCTMPSRVRAILYNEKREELISRMSASMQNLISAGASRIILGCNTSHVFFNDIYKLHPEIKNYVINIIDECVCELTKKKIRKVYLLATEGTILSEVYNQKLVASNIQCDTPGENEFENLRICIEAVKTNCYDEKVKSLFIDFITRGDACILGCTELPILYDKYKGEISKVINDKIVIDPLYLALCKAKQEYITLHQ